MISTASKMFQKIKDRIYRKAFIAGQIRKTIPVQIRMLRASRQMTQKDLAKAIRTTQTAISRMEKGKGNLSIKTLLKLAEAFDTALVVRFEPIDRLMEWASELSPETLAPLPSGVILENMEALARMQTHLAELAQTIAEIPPSAIDNISVALQAGTASWPLFAGASNLEGTDASMTLGSLSNSNTFAAARPAA
jgi:transcriptional regulator with XRE-family HTH domain